MTRRALIIVDVQPGFCEGGSLAVDGGNACAERIADFVTDNREEYTLVVTTQDWHIDPGEHFSSAPDFVDTWPAHCVAGTDEAELHEAIASLDIDVSVKKGAYSAAYSGFEGETKDEQTLESVLREADIDEIDVVGIAESHCVKETALDALKAGWRVRVLSDLTVPVSEELGVAARHEMDEAGIEQLESGEAFGFYEEPEDDDIPGDYASSSSAYGADSFGGFDSYSDDDDYDDDNDDDTAYSEEDDADLDALLAQFDDFDTETIDSTDTLSFDFGGDIEDTDLDFSNIDYRPR